MAPDGASQLRAQDKLGAVGCDTAVAVSFLRWARPDGPWILTSIDPETGKTDTRTFEAGDADAAARWIDECQCVKNLYWMVNSALRPLTKKAAKADVASLTFLHVDLDPPKGEPLEPARAAIKARLETFEPRPSAIVDSGGGFQAFWRLDDERYLGGDPNLIPDAEGYNIALARALGGDHCHNVDRIMRLPGTVNVPNATKRAAGRAAVLARIVHQSDVAYSLAEFTSAQPERTRALGPSCGAPSSVMLPDTLPKVQIEMLPISARLRTLICEGSDPERYPSRSEAVFAVLCAMARANCGNDTMAAVILDPTLGISASILEKQRPRQEAARQIKRALEKVASSGVELHDFYAYLPMHTYVFVPTRELWPAASINNHLPKVVLTNEKGGADEIPASLWLDKNRHVEQMTWCPGQPLVITDRLVADGGWIERPGCSTFNLYRPPTVLSGDASKAGPWLDLLNKVYPDDAAHIIRWLAHRVQRPHEKINHALFLGGDQGIGKDTLLEPVKAAVGPWNFSEVSPKQLFGRFNGYLKSVVLRLSEARDLGEIDRYAFYEHMKTYTANPPDVLRIDEKFLREYPVFNICGVIITSNHKTDGIYLPADDRRHYIAWSPLTRAEFGEGDFKELYDWYDSGGISDVAAYLREFDLAEFNPKAPPPQTDAFWEIVAANGAPEDAELADALADLRSPAAVTIDEVISCAMPGFAAWLGDRKNSRMIPHRLREAGYTVVHNRAAKDGMFKVRGRHLRIYAKRELSARDALVAAEELVERLRSRPDPF